MLTYLVDGSPSTRLARRLVKLNQQPLRPSPASRSGLARLGARDCCTGLVDVGVDRLMIELSGTEDKVEAFIELARPYGILELARTGVIAMPRGQTSKLSRTRSTESTPPPAPTVDEADLPPG